MKWIKTYKLFEASDSNLIEDIKDIFLELKDEGFTINVKDGWRFSNSYEIQINKVSDPTHESGSESKEFLLRNISYCISVLKSYLKDTDYYIYEVRGYDKNKRKINRNRTEYSDVPEFRIQQQDRANQRGIDKNISWVKNIDPNINFQEPNEELDISLIEVEIIIRKKK